MPQIGTQLEKTTDNGTTVWEIEDRKIVAAWCHDPADGVTTHASDASEARDWFECDFPNGHKLVDKWESPE